MVAVLVLASSVILAGGPVRSAEPAYTGCISSNQSGAQQDTGVPLKIRKGSNPVGKSCGGDREIRFNAFGPRGPRGEKHGFGLDGESL